MTARYLAAAIHAASLTVAEAKQCAGETHCGDSGMLQL
jgi:hypothetical protein